MIVLLKRHLVTGLLAAWLVGGLPPAEGAAPRYAIDIINNAYYPNVYQTGIRLLLDDQGTAYSTIANDFTPDLGLTYHATKITAPGQWEYVRPGGWEAVNASGDVTVGWPPSGQIYRQGILETLPEELRADDPYASVSGVSAQGVVYGGYIENDLVNRGFTWDGVQLRRLSASPSGDSAMNSLGVLGLSEYRAEPDGTNTIAMYLYDTTQGMTTPLQAPSGFRFESYEMQVTNFGALARLQSEDFDVLRDRYGIWNLDGSFREFLPQPDFPLSNVRINDSGQAVAKSYPSQDIWHFDGAAWSEVVYTDADASSLESSLRGAQITAFNNRGEFGGTFRGPVGGAFIARLSETTTPQNRPGPPVLNPANGHYYQFITPSNLAEPITFHDALTAASNRTHEGRSGHLVTITSIEEQEFLVKTFGGLRNTWIWVGASDSENEGEWKWITGPEAGQIFWRGGPSGEALGFQRWNGGEPNDDSRDGEDFAEAKFDILGSFFGFSMWNDVSANDSSFAYGPRGYLVEYSAVPEPIALPSAILALVVLGRRTKKVSGTNGTVVAK